MFFPQKNAYVRHICPSLSTLFVSDWHRESPNFVTTGKHSIGSFATSVHREEFENFQPLTKNFSGIRSVTVRVFIWAFDRLLIVAPALIITASSRCLLVLFARTQSRRVTALPTSHLTLLLHFAQKIQVWKIKSPLCPSCWFLRTYFYSKYTPYISSIKINELN